MLNNINEYQLSNCMCFVTGCLKDVLTFIHGKYFHLIGIFNYLDPYSSQIKYMCNYVAGL